MNRSVAWELVRTGHLVRGVRLAPYAPAVVALVVFLVVHRGTHDVLNDPRALGLLLALGGGYALDDGAAVTLQASPYGLARRVGLRIGAAVAVIAPLWTVMLAGRLPRAPAAERWTLGLGLTVELAAALAGVWAVAAWGRRHGVDQPGLITSPVLLASVFVALSFSRAPMVVGPGPQWTAAHLRWSGVLAGAACLLVAATRDPAARWLRRHGRGGPPAVRPEHEPDEDGHQYQRRADGAVP
jgi:hypothetical protein